MGSTQNFARAIVRGVDAGEVRLGVNLHRLNVPGSPAFSLVDTAAPIVLLLALNVYVFVWHGWVLGLLCLLASVLVYGFVVGRWIADRVQARTLVLLRRQPHLLEELWNSGAISLTHIRTDTFACHPDEYRPFVVEHLLADRPAEGANE
jgi:hypothetical protein